MDKIIVMDFLVYKSSHCSAFGGVKGDITVFSGYQGWRLQLLVYWMQAALSTL
jgi:hypothetical protein